ncbi:MAG TPA: hypothetical protein VFZ53_25200 [Polyangiaceae bacterium]
MVARIFAAMLAFVVSPALAGCSEEFEVTVENEGALCVHPVGAEGDPFACPEVEFAAGAVLRLSVNFQKCMSSSCDRDPRTSCKATVNGNVITVTAKGSYTHEEGECTDDCGFLVASCEVGPLPAGDYELHYAGETLALSLPSARFNVCTPGSFGYCCDGDSDCGQGTCAEGHHCAVSAEAARM